MKSLITAPSALDWDVPIIGATPPRKRLITFRGLVVLLLAVFCIELIICLGLPWATSKIRERTKNVLRLVRSRAPARKDDLGDLLPASIGSLYVLTERASPFAKNEKNLQRFKDLSDAQNDIALKSFIGGLRDDDCIGMLALAQNRTGNFHALEPLLIIQLAKTDHSDILATALNLVYMAGLNAEEAGMIEEARANYAQFLDDAYLASEYSLDGSPEALAENARRQRQLTHARIRLKTLKPSHSFQWQKLRDLNSGRLDNVRKHIEDLDEGIRAMSILTLAAGLFNIRQVDNANATLTKHFSQCGSLLDECEYLLARVHAVLWFSQRDESVAPLQAEEAIRPFRVLLNRIGSSHYLADDVYLSMAWTLRDAGAEKEAMAVATEGINSTHGDRRLSLEHFVNDARQQEYYRRLSQGRRTE